jgi:pimeloyl-ACP methyl ester carboxylesterase
VALLMGLWTLGNPPERVVAQVDAGFADVNGARLYYEVSGEGEPLLLLSGLGMNHLGWALQIPVYAREFKVIAFDNRGTGQSSSPEGVDYTIALLADDAAALLDALGVDAAHVYGVSLGGMIAQEMALRHPEKVRSLILGATWPGGPNTVPPEASAAAALAEFVGSGESITPAFFDVLFSPGFLADHGAEFLELGQLLADYPATPTEVLTAQAGAAARHDTYDRLPEITAPTLVIHGTDDTLIPTENGRILAERIPGAELILLEGARHAYLWEKQAESDAAILDFLRRHSGVASAPPVELPATGSGGVLAESGGSTAVWWYVLPAASALLILCGLAGVVRPRRVSSRSDGLQWGPWIGHTPSASQRTWESSLPWPHAWPSPSSSTGPAWATTSSTMTSSSLGRSETTPSGR